MSEHQQRLARAVAALTDTDALVVTNLGNVRYLTGYTGSNGIVVASTNRTVLITDFRYQDAVEPLRAVLDVEISRSRYCRSYDRAVGGIRAWLLHDWL